MKITCSRDNCFSDVGNNSNFSVFQLVPGQSEQIDFQIENKSGGNCKADFSVSADFAATDLFNFAFFKQGQKIDSIDVFENQLENLYLQIENIKDPSIEQLSHSFYFQALINFVCDNHQQASEVELLNNVKTEYFVTEKIEVSPEAIASPQIFNYDFDQDQSIDINNFVSPSPAPKVLATQDYKVNPVSKNYLSELKFKFLYFSLIFLLILIIVCLIYKIIKKISDD